MTQLNNQTIADIVSEHSSTAEIFVKHRLDFCSLGDKILSDLVSDTNINIKQLLHELEIAINNEPPNNINFNSLSVTELSEIIRSEYHEYLRNKITELTALSQKVRSQHRIDEINKVHEHLLLLFDNLAPHMLHEEKVLFPYLEYMEHMVNKGRSPKPPSFGKLTKTVASMLDEHSASTERLDGLRELTNNYLCPANADDNMQYYYQELHRLDKNLRMHIHIENNVLFKKAKTMEDLIHDN